MKSTIDVVQKGIELLALCQKLQSNIDGVDRPDLFSVDKSKTLDQFAKDISEAAIYHGMLLKLIPMQERLSEMGRKLESCGQIKVEIGDSYANVALAYFEAQMAPEEKI